MGRLWKGSQCRCSCNGLKRFGTSQRRRTPRSSFPIPCWAQWQVSVPAWAQPGLDGQALELVDLEGSFWRVLLNCLSLLLLLLLLLPRFGVFERSLPPGMYVYNCMSQDIQKVSMKMQAITIPRQAAMTRDNLSVVVDAVAFVTVIDAAKAVFAVEDYYKAAQTLAASMLLRAIGEHDLQEIFRDRARINERLTETMQSKTAGWGLEVSSVELRDITIPDVMQRAMAQIAEANREADAKVIVAEGQRKAAFIFAEAAEAMERQPMSLQLQWFETLRNIAAVKNSTVIVPDSLLGTMAGLRASVGAAGAGWTSVGTSGP